MMKKVLAVFLCLCIALSSLAVGVYALCNDEELNFVAASDIHYLKPRNEISGNIDDPIYWYSNNRGTLEDESGFLLDGFLKECAQNDDCDYVFIAGDLADNGRSNPEDHRFVAEKLKTIRKRLYSCTFSNRKSSISVIMWYSTNTAFSISTCQNCWRRFIRVCLSMSRKVPKCYLVR